jgi:hypothetical protein
MAGIPSSVPTTRLWARRGRAAVPVLLVASALVTYDQTDSCTWEMGDASWRVFHARWAQREREPNPDGPPAADVSDEAIAGWLQTAQRWRARQTAWAWGCYAVAAASVAVLVLRRGWLSFGACLACLYLAWKCWWLMRIRF